MSEPIAVINKTKLSDEVLTPLRAILGQQSSLERVLAWFFSSQPPLAPADLIAQDEFSYDLLVPLGDGCWLSYDTT